MALRKNLPTGGRAAHEQLTLLASPACLAKTVRSGLPGQINDGRRFAHHLMVLRDGLWNFCCTTVQHDK